MDRMRDTAVSTPTTMPTPRLVTWSQYFTSPFIEVASAAPLVAVPKIPRKRIAMESGVMGQQLFYLNQVRFDALYPISYLIIAGLATGIYRRCLGRSSEWDCQFNVKEVC